MISARKLSEQVLLILVLAYSAGCRGPLVVSHRFDPRSQEANGAGVCDCRSLLEHSVRCAKGPLPQLPGSEPISHGLPVEAGPDTIQPPHSRFHPVPTRPVFAPREEDSPLQPLPGLGTIDPK